MLPAFSPIGIPESDTCASSSGLQTVYALRVPSREARAKPQLSRRARPALTHFLPKPVVPLLALKWEKRNCLIDQYAVCGHRKLLGPVRKNSAEASDILGSSRQSIAPKPELNVRKAWLREGSPRE